MRRSQADSTNRSLAAFGKLQHIQNAGCTLSVYADDLTISGETVPEAAIWEIKKVL